MANRKILLAFENLTFDGSDIKLETELQYIESGNDKILFWP